MLTWKPPFERGCQRGFIGQGLFSALVLMGVVTTLLAPISFNAVVERKMREHCRETGQL